MKKTILLAMGLISFSFSLQAQETEEPPREALPAVEKDSTRFRLFLGLGMAVIGDYNINDNLTRAGMPNIGNESPEITFGYNIMVKNFSMDVEANANYFDRKHPENRVQMAGAGFKVRPHYIAVKREKFLLSAGLDVSFIVNSFELYKRGTVIDLNNLAPSDYSGRISLNNQLFYAGPSVTAEFFRHWKEPLRLTAGYDIAFTNGKWESAYSNVVNTVSESGHNRFYAKIYWYFL